MDNIYRLILINICHAKQMLEVCFVT